MMTPMMENFQGASQSETQAVISAPEMAAFLPSEVSHATRAFDSSKNEAERLTKDVAERSAERIAGGAPSQEASDDFSRRRPDAWRVDEQIPLCSFGHTLSQQ